MVSKVVSEVTPPEASKVVFGWGGRTIGTCSSVLTRQFPLQDVFLMIRRKKTTIFTDAKDNTTVQELKKMIEGRVESFIWESVLGLI